MTNAYSNIQMRDAFIAGLYEKAKLDKNIVFISNEYGAPTLDRFREEFPNQFINAGISEQNIISVAAGLAMEGKKVFIYSIASFITLRCFEQIKLDICCHNLPVTILGVGACYAYSEDGPSHHATEDISIMRTLVGMEIYAPSDSEIAYDFVDVALSSKVPMYIRFDKGRFPVLKNLSHKKTQSFREFFIENNSSQTCIFSMGIMTQRALEVAKTLKQQGVYIKTIDLFKLKPLHKKEILKTLQGIANIITIEEHTINGGLGSIIAELITDNYLSVRLKRIAVNDEDLYTYGNRDTLHLKLGLDRDSLVAIVVDFINNRKV
jgi:transketolase